MSTSTAQQKRLRLKRKIRAKVNGTPARPRLSVFRSNNYVYAQLIDDTTATTIAAANDMTTKGTKLEGAVATGTALAAAAKAKNITAVVFDRGGFKYAGRIKALADAARAAGLEF
jgi:large subunit ribosomal protein L18